MHGLSLIEYGGQPIYSNINVGSSFTALTAVRTLHIQHVYLTLHPSEHWATRYKRFPIAEITSKMTYEESDYIMTECNQDTNAEEMSISWLTEQLRSIDFGQQV